MSIRNEGDPGIVKHKDLECLGSYTGKKMYVELRGDPPLVPGRNEIAIRAKVVEVKEFNVKQKTITIEIPLSLLASLSNSPITREQKTRSKPK